MNDNNRDKCKAMFTDNNTGIVHILSNNEISEILFKLLNVDITEDNYLEMYKHYNSFSLYSNGKSTQYEDKGFVDEAYGRYYYFRLGQILYYQIINSDKKHYLDRIIKRSYITLLKSKKKDSIDTIRNTYKIVNEIIPDAAYDMLINKSDKIVRGRVLNWLLGLSYPDINGKEYESLMDIDKRNIKNDDSEE